MKLAAEFLTAKDDPSTLQTFVNTILGQGWRGEGEELADDDLAARAEVFGLEAVPAEVLALTAGVDVQHDRLEITVTGWAEGGGCLVLGHRVIWGAWDDNDTWAELDELLRARWPHALGGRIGLDAAALDAGDGTTMERVIAFARPRTRARVVAIKGAPGNRPVIEAAASKTKSGARLWIVGVDTVKTQLFARLSRRGLIRLSAELPRVWHEQVASERSVLRYRRGQPVRSFERIPGRRAEALDCLVYATAARALFAPDWSRRRDELAQAIPASTRPSPVLQSNWMKR